MYTCPWITGDCLLPTLLIRWRIRMGTGGCLIQSISVGESVSRQVTRTPSQTDNASRRFHSVKFLSWSWFISGPPQSKALPLGQGQRWVFSSQKGAWRPKSEQFKKKKRGWCRRGACEPLGNGCFALLGPCAPEMAVPFTQSKTLLYSKYIKNPLPLSKVSPAKEWTF